MFLLFCYIGFNEAFASDELVVSIISLNKEIRKKHDLSPQNQSDKLTKAAVDHAKYMVEKHDLGYDDFNHRGNNGSPGTRAAKYGYIGVVSENIARGFSSIDKMFTAWVNSKSHYNTITGDTVDIGVGIAISKDGVMYVVVLYGKPRA